jgi:hypothetical protein
MGVRFHEKNVSGVLDGIIHLNERLRFAFNCLREVLKGKELGRFQDI